MKKYFTAITAIALISIAPYALAASSTDLSVTGTITPEACTPSLSNGGVVDHGKISAKDLNPSTATAIGSHPMQLAVNCDAPTTFALTPIDNNPGTASNRDWYGFGLSDAGEKLGFVIAMVSSTLADGQPAQSILSVDNGATWYRHHHLRPARLVSAASTTDHSTPIAVENLSFELELTSFIARADSLTLIDEVNFNGSVTFEMKYL